MPETIIGTTNSTVNPDLQNDSKPELSNFQKYFRSFVSRPWSVLFLINIVCAIILYLAQQSNKIVCPDNGQCAKDIIQTYNQNGDTAYQTMISYFSFYIIGLAFAHGYSFYSDLHDNKLNSKLAQTLACFLVAIVVVFTVAIAYVYLTFGNI
jgi:uncharacterized membrane protein